MAPPAVELGYDETARFGEVDILLARRGNQWVDSGRADESVRWRRSFRQVDSKDRCCSSESE